MELPDFTKIEGFEGDIGNIDKNWKKYKVKPGETEEIFFNDPLIVIPEDYHSNNEDKFAFLGVTNEGRKLFAIVTIRIDKIRPISVRDMTPKEKKFYEKS